MSSWDSPNEKSESDCRDQAEERDYNYWNYFLESVHIYISTTRLGQTENSGRDIYYARR